MYEEAGCMDSEYAFIRKLNLMKYCLSFVLLCLLAGCSIGTAEAGARYGSLGSTFYIDYQLIMYYFIIIFTKYKY